MELFHAGQVGMKWGYKKGAENGKRKKANPVEVDSMGNKYTVGNSGTTIYLDSNRKRMAKRTTLSSVRRDKLPPHYRPALLLRRVKNVALKSVNPKVIARGKQKLEKRL